jgi:thioredoxin-related protein
VKQTIAVVTVAALLSGLLPLAAGAEGIQWHKGLPEALQASRDSGKLVMLNLHTEWCGWCKKLEQDTFPAEAVIEASQAFECVSVDPEKTEVDARYNDGSFPRTVFLTAEGEVVTAIGGYLPPAEFAAEMAKAKDALAKLREVQELEKQVEAPEKNPELAVRIAVLYGELDQYKKVLEWLKPLHENLDGVPEAQRADVAVEYGSALVAEMQFPEAEAVLKPFLEASGDHARAREARFVLGYAYANQDKLQEARECWAKVAEADAEDDLGRMATDLVGRVDAALKETNP